MNDLVPVEVDVVAAKMLEFRGDLVKVSRDPSISFNIMALRKFVKENPLVRKCYHELLADELQEKGLHIAERILKMAELQEQAFGVEYTEYNPVTKEDETKVSPADPRMVIELSKEISRLISESKGQNVSSKSALLIASKEDAVDLLKGFLDS